MYRTLLQLFLIFFSLSLAFAAKPPPTLVNNSSSYHHRHAMGKICPLVFSSPDDAVISDTSPVLLDEDLVN